MTPQHYTQTLEPASRLPKEDQAPFWKGQIIKYFSRAGLKEGVPFEADFAKGLHCVERYKQCLQEVVQEPTPAYRDLGPHKIPEGCRPLENHEMVQDGDWFNSEKTPELPWHKVNGSGGYHAGKYMGVIFARPIEPEPAPTPADTPKYMTLRHFSEVPEGYQRIDTAGPFEPDDLVVAYFNGAYQCVPYESWGGEELPFGVALRKAKPTYRDLGPHTIPEGCRQLADDEVVEKGDLFNDVRHRADTWSIVDGSIGKRVENAYIHYVYARPC